MMKHSKNRWLCTFGFIATFGLTGQAAQATTSITNGGNLIFLSTLELELGGLTPGAQHDQILATGFVALGGTLDIVLVNSWVPSDGDVYTLIRAEQILSLDAQNQPLFPSFAQVNYPELSPGLNFLLEFNLDPAGQDSMALSVTSVPLPPAIWMLGAGLAGLLTRRRALPG